MFVMLATKKVKPEAAMQLREIFMKVYEK